MNGPSSASPSPAPPPAPRLDDRRADATFLFLAALTIGLAALLQTRGPVQVVLPGLDFPLPDSCTSRRMLGVDCPGCGLTRSFVRLAHGDPLGAWAFHPVGPLLFAFIAAQIPYRLWQLWRIGSGRGRWIAGPWIHLPLAVIITLMLARWIARLCGAAV